jgi:hypothetical protein
MQRLLQWCVRFVQSSAFFVLTMLLFVLSAGWIALSARYPMAFDEGYHLGIILLYTHQFSPFFAHQPAGPATYGALTRDPSYLFHWLMSFPYRLVSLWTTSLQVHVIVLRFIDIALFASGLVLMRKVLLKTRASKAIVNLTMLFVVLVPVVPLLAGQINYDDMLVPLTALALLLTVNFAERLNRRHEVDIRHLIYILVVSLLACLVKFPFLPIMTAVVVYLGFLFWQFSRAHPHKLWSKLRTAWRPISRFQKVWLLAILLLSIGLFINTYGVNILKYHNPIPQCGQVLSVQRCSTYPPWARNYADAKYNTGVDANPLRFTASWFYGMFTRLFFTINGPGNPNSNANFIAPVLAMALPVLLGIGVLLFLIYGWKILRHDAVLVFLLFITLSYCVALWGRNYHDFLHLGEMVAINGRYLIPVMFPVVLVLALSYQQLLSKSPVLKALMLLIALLVFLEGGGAISYVYYSKSYNARLQKIIKPFFITR